MSADDSKNHINKNDTIVNIPRRRETRSVRGKNRQSNLNFQLRNAKTKNELNEYINNISQQKQKSKNRKNNNDEEL